tara:strand:- start:59335 stop:62496 length:3162 start_codon:yes stop_codon:yes gene_type:complete
MLDTNVIAADNMLPSRATDCVVQHPKKVFSVLVIALLNRLLGIRSLLGIHSGISAVIAFLFLGMVSGLARAEAAEFTRDQLEFFEKRVRPLLSEHCYECHSAQSEKLQAGLMLDSRSAMVAGGDSGPSVVPGDPSGSLFIEAVRYESYEMPPDGKLSDKDVATLEEWIRQGAPWPQEEPPSPHADRPVFDLQQRASEHWVWQPVRSPAIPSVQGTMWPTSELDHFVLAKLEQNDLSPVGGADRSAILRRLYLDLIGLPPTAEETSRFLADTSPVAIERVVDRLLESHHFGERWGRHWLDLVRYAESRGHEFDDDAVNAYQYRDYVIRAFNADVPYDQLVREHIAGDLIDKPRLHPEAGFNESVLGTGFWFLGEWVHSPVDILKDESDRFDNMIDVMSKTFLGVTVSCARCHDHKFDAISTADYYSLTGFLHSSDYRQVRFDSMQSNRDVANQIARTDAAFRQRVKKLLDDQQLVLPEPKSLPDAIADSIVFDYEHLSKDQFIQDGYIFGDGPRRAGDAWLDTSGDRPEIRIAAAGAAVNDPIWNGLVSQSQPNVTSRSALSKIPRSGRTLRTPTFELTGENVVCRVHGQGHVVACVDSHRLVAGPLHKQTIAEIKPDSNSVVLDLSRYLGHRIHLEFTPAENASLHIVWVAQGSRGQTKRVLKTLRSDTMPLQLSLNTLLLGTAQSRQDDSDKAYAKVDDGLRRLAAQWAKKREKLQAQIVKRSRLAMAMLDGSGEDAHVYIRGSSSNPGPLEPRHFLTAVAGNEPMSIDRGSGRLQLARQINDPSNPLASRVIVNRIWHHLMGRGIVPTTDDFGVLGRRPTHPELLDHLATKFLNDGRSMKRMIRYIVLSRTYQMSSKPDEFAVQADPNNLLWHHRPPKRLEGEAVRDSLLAVSGKINAALFGPPVPIHLTSFMTGRGRPKASGPLDGDGRRSIYVAVRRNFLSPFMLAFDTPVPFSTMGRRNVSNVPAQALILMNDPFVAQQARGWAERAMQRKGDSSDRVQWMFLTAFARLPSQSESDVALAFLGDNPDVDRWSDFAHALINTKEFIFLR